MARNEADNVSMDKVRRTKEGDENTDPTNQNRTRAYNRVRRAEDTVENSKDNIKARSQVWKLSISIDRITDEELDQNLLDTEINLVNENNSFLVGSLASYNLIANLNDEAEAIPIRRKAVWADGL